MALVGTRRRDSRRVKPIATWRLFAMICHDRTTRRRSRTVKPVLVIGLIGSLLLAGVTPVRAAEFFVSPTGNDADPGTLEKPFATVQRA